MGLTTLSPVGGTLVKATQCLEGEALLEKVGYWTWALKIYSPPHPGGCLLPEYGYNMSSHPPIPAPPLPTWTVFSLTESKINPSFLKVSSQGILS